jgi:hypothetical protein
MAAIPNRTKTKLCQTPAQNILNIQNVLTKFIVQSLILMHCLKMVTNLSWRNGPTTKRCSEHKSTYAPGKTNIINTPKPLTLTCSLFCVLIQNLTITE